jgi:ABC-type transport system involved in multi-copper enzyme maturation permease subunit
MIIRKEMLANVTSLRFVLTLLLITVVFIVSGLVFVGKYEQEAKDFSDTSNKNLSRLQEVSNNLSNVPNYTQVICKQPKITQLCCEGFEKSLPNTFRMSAFSIQNPEIVARSNFLFPRFADIDWAFIISFILSFVAFLMTFDSFSAEKERGTLKLVMSNPIARDKVILGKYISGVLTLMIPLVVGLLLNLIIMSFSGLSFLDSVQWIKVLAFMGASILYLSVFILFGMLVSSRSAKSSSSIVILLFVWVIVVMVIPSVGGLTAEKFAKAPARSEIERRINEAGDEIWNNADRYGKNAGSWAGGVSPKALRTMDWVNPSARARLFNAITDSRNQLNGEYINRIIAQVSLGRNATRISPTVMYQCASEAIIGTGVIRFRNLYNQLNRYRETLKDFVMSIDRKDTDSFHLWAEGQQHQILLSQKPVDYNAIPKFEEIEPSMGPTLRNAMWDIGALILLNVLLFMGVYISFLRSDIR